MTGASEAGRGADSALLPAEVRRVVYAGLGVVLAFAAYLFLVRGPALLFDLKQAAVGMFCL